MLILPKVIKFSQTISLRSWDKLLKRIGLEDFRWHDLRHCCASYLAQDGKSLGMIGKHTLAISLLPVQTVIRTLAVRKQSRPGNQFPRGCMDNVDKRVFEKVANQQTVGNAGGSAGSRTPDHLIKSLMYRIIHDNLG